MFLGGIVKTSTLDYPAKICAVIFTQGCNFHCPYCHNPDQIQGPGNYPGALDETEIMAFLLKRRGLLDGVVVSGGEPTIQNDLSRFLTAIKELGYPVKLDTNGSNPALIDQLLSHGLVDYLAVDLKTIPKNYHLLSNDPAISQKIIQTIELVVASGQPAEFRTTCLTPLVDRDLITQIASAAQGPIPLYLQKYRPERVYDRQFMSRYPRQPDENDLKDFCNLAGQYLTCRIR
ncbi:MAG: anaerobic ribonucleoside-triphosphate reductase activating protein [Deltaproteobacteria bacterium]|nr:anaerobic ribonucleoside-triphosphate reductase activating protein [Deltaproteobacteria bacterium]